MFYVWNTGGVKSPYQSGAIRRSRNVDSVKAVPSIGQKEAEQKGIAQYQERQEKLPEKGIYASQIMSAPVETLTESSPITEAFRLFSNKAFRHVPVVNQSGVLSGILSDRALLKEGISSLSEAKKSERTVKDVASPRVVSAHPKTLIRDIARVLFEERIGAVPIVGDSGQVEGIVTRSDILRVIMKHPSFEIWI